MELTPEEYEKYAESAGAIARKLVVAIVERRSYDKLPDAVKSKLISDAFNQARTVARIRLKAKGIRRVRSEEGTPGLRRVLTPLPEVPAQ